MSAPLTVKFIAKGAAHAEPTPWRRQLPDAAPAWGRCRFLFDPEARHYDWLVVYDDLPARPGERFSTRCETLACPRQQTLLITAEPSSIKHYSRSFLAQFGHILTSQEPQQIDHPNAHFSQPALRWFYAIGKQHHRSYDQLRQQPPPPKPRPLATVCSSKRQRHTLHNRRYRFTQQLAQAIPELDHYGHGIRPLDDKAAAIDPYRYHLAIENHICRHHWTEKLADPLLGYALPLYCGCPNLDDYFPREAIIAIDLFDLEQSRETIRATLRDDPYQQRLPALIEARRLVLERYNLFAVISRLIEGYHQPGHKPHGAVEILSRRALIRRHPLAAAYERLLR